MRERIDPLIAERARWLYGDKLLVDVARRIAESLLKYDETIRIAETIKDMNPEGIMADMAQRIAYDVEVRGLHNIPAYGPALIVANHPTGIADGIFVHHVLAEIRSDVFFFANSDILRVLPQMEQLIVPVEWQKNKRTHAKTRETMQQTARALRDGRMGVIFPSGRLAKRRGLSLFERDWMSSAVMIARKFNVPIIPVNIRARNSVLFYILDLIHPTLRDITLFYETLNKDKQPYRLVIGAPIQPSTLPARSADAIKILRRDTLALSGIAAPGVSLVRATRLLQGMV
ncbi:MAG: lysophospholipid acyltransferase family protein [Pseudomonadota bacterium]